MAYRPRTRRAAFGERVLVDFGRDSWELLECVPNYRDAVVSFNAGYVGLLRVLADLLRRIGHGDEASASDVDADELAAAVLGQYAGDGRWRIAHPEGDETIGHCLDFALVTADLSEDLSPARKKEMVDFVTTHRPPEPLTAPAGRLRNLNCHRFDGQPTSMRDNVAVTVVGSDDRAMAKARRRSWH